MTINQPQSLFMIKILTQTIYIFLFIKRERIGVLLMNQVMRIGENSQLDITKKLNLLKE